MMKTKSENESKSASAKSSADETKWEMRRKMAAIDTKLMRAGSAAVNAEGCLNHVLHNPDLKPTQANRIAKLCAAARRLRKSIYGEFLLLQSEYDLEESALTAKGKNLKR